ncbi:uncharacterized protein LOC122804404 [Protopterus annectens]|uniref:uncharacterized protein LOC122804404 n=1 Tax=Protopterus annectens TaxID=7888 RepID=UPI001CFAC9C1|nr:uncharacterized protein LOC122804404 [Protopterus annectens]
MFSRSSEEELYACVFIASDVSVWTQPVSDLHFNNNNNSSSSSVTVGSQVAFKLPVQFTDEESKQVILGEQDQEGTILAVCAGFELCNEKQKYYKRLIDENKCSSPAEILNLLVNDANRSDCSISSNITSKSGVQLLDAVHESMPSKRRKAGELLSVPHHMSNINESFMPVTVTQVPNAWNAPDWCEPAVPVKSEQAEEMRARNPAENNYLQMPWNDLQPQEEEKGEGENPFAVLEKLIKENQMLKKENARLKQMLQAAQNAIPFRLLSQDTRQSAVFYLRMVLEQLEGIVSPPWYNETMGRNLNSSPATEVRKSPQDKNLRPLVVDPADPERFSEVLVDSNKLYNVVKKAREQKVHEGGCLLNGVIDLVFTAKELSESHGLGLKGKNKEDKALDRVKVAACEVFLRQTCAKEGWKEPSQLEFRKKFTAKICNSRRDMKSSAQQ